MIVREKIIEEIYTINDVALENRLYEYLQLLKRGTVSFISNTKEVLKFSGSITNEDADEIKEIINTEFNKIEGVW